MDSNKEIKVYGTFVNWTINDLIKDNTHNDAVAYAKQLYDDRFGASPNAANFQDVINKRLTAISYANGITTIDSPFVVNGTSNLNGNSTISNLTVTGPTNLQDTLTVAGKTTVNNKIESTQDITAKGLTINGNAAVNGELSVSVLHPTNGLVVNGTTVLNDGVTVKGGATIADTGLTVSNGNVRIATGNLSVDQGEVGGKTLDIETTGAIHGNLTVGGSVTATGNVSAPNVNYAIARLDALLEGITDHDLDTIKEIADWIENHQDLFEQIVALASALRSDLTTETNNRISADAALGARIDQEISDRAAAIQTETTNRNTAISNAISPLQTAINTINTSIADFSTRISSLESTIQTLSSLWTLSGDTVTTSYKASAAGFYDTTVS